MGRKEWSDEAGKFSSVTVPLCLCRPGSEIRGIGPSNLFSGLRVCSVPPAPRATPESLMPSLSLFNGHQSMMIGGGFSGNILILAWQLSFNAPFFRGNTSQETVPRTGLESSLGSLLPTPTYLQHANATVIEVIRTTVDALTCCRLATHWLPKQTRHLPTYGRGYVEAPRRLRLASMIIIALQPVLDSNTNCEFPTRISKRTQIAICIRTRVDL